MHHGGRRWAEVVHNGVTGWVDSQFLTDEKPQSVMQQPLNSKLKQWQPINKSWDDFRLMQIEQSMERARIIGRHNEYLQLQQERAAGEYAKSSYVSWRDEVAQTAWDIAENERQQRMAEGDARRAYKHQQWVEENSRRWREEISPAFARDQQLREERRQAEGWTPTTPRWRQQPYTGVGAGDPPFSSGPMMFHWIGP